MQKFTVSVITVEGGFTLQIKNRAGRCWVSNIVSACPGNCAEDAMVIEECLILGTKLTASQWTEAAR
jgi:hypothetical protein